MNNDQIHSAFDSLSTPLITDALVRLNLPYRAAPAGIRAIASEMRLAGRALPVRHYGSVDIFLEAYGFAQPGDVMVIDNNGRDDQGCIGDLTAIEAQAHNVAGFVIWGTHRDTPELLKLDFTVFSYGSFPFGPTELVPRPDDAVTAAQFGAHTITRDDVVFADLDGVVFAPYNRIDEILTIAEQISETERKQAAAVRAGRTLRQQLQFEKYLAKREADPTYSFRQHLRAIGGAIEE